jgi:(p)ppGpp synthase/HD superfamily hydrolase
MQQILEKIIAFTDHAHGDQRRKYTPDRYIVHPIRVMETCRKFTNDVTILAAALLHDVLEDTPVQKEDIRNFLLGILTPQQAEQTLRMVVELTDVYVKENYPELNRKARKAKELERLKRTSAASQTIKYADILDNSIEIAVHDPEFAAVYLRESQTILRHLTKGNATLHAEVLKTLEEALRTLRG